MVRERRRVLKPTIPLQLHHSWPLFERGSRFDLGLLFGPEAPGGRGLASFGEESPVAQDIGRWSCDLADNSLTWTDPVFDLFGLPRDARLARDEIVALYREESRAAMERLRAYAIRHRRGFTIDVEIRTVGGCHRWMRLLAAPVCEGEHIVRLEGLKQDVSREYERASISRFRSRRPTRDPAATRSAHPWR